MTRSRLNLGPITPSERAQWDWFGACEQQRLIDEALSRRARLAMFNDWQQRSEPEPGA